MSGMARGPERRVLGCVYKREAARFVNLLKSKKGNYTPPPRCCTQK